jgi:hypothetical protein
LAPLKFLTSSRLIGGDWYMLAVGKAEGVAVEDGNADNLIDTSSITGPQAPSVIDPI